MANQPLPKACLHFLKNRDRLQKAWDDLLKNLDKQTFLLDSHETFDEIEFLIQKEEDFFKEILSLSEFLKTSAKDLQKNGYLSDHEIKSWQVEQKRESERYLTKKNLISTKLKNIQGNLQAERDENKKKRIARPVSESVTKASILDISL